MILLNRLYHRFIKRDAYKSNLYYDYPVTGGVPVGSSFINFGKRTHNLGKGWYYDTPFKKYKIKYGRQDVL